MEKFKLEKGEQVLKKGNILYYVGDPLGVWDTMKAAAKGQSVVKECTVFLTTSRFVACKKRRYYPWGPLIWIFVMLLRRKIVFAVALSSLASIECDTGRSIIFKLKTADGSLFRVAATGFGDKRKKWIAAISAAVKAARPEISVSEADGTVDFKPAVAAQS